MSESANDTTAATVESTEGKRIVSGHAIASDGVELYWRAVGDGPWIACCNGVGVSTFFWKYVTAQFADRYTVILWDYRGHGRSHRGLNPDDADMSIERHADDLKAVLNSAATAMGLATPRLPFSGRSMGCRRPRDSTTLSRPRAWTCADAWHRREDTLDILRLVTLAKNLPGCSQSTVQGGSPSQ